MESNDIVIKLKIKEIHKGFIITHENVLEQPLSELRCQVNSEIGDLIPKEFFFIVEDTPVGEIQEKTLKTKYISKHLEAHFMGMKAYVVMLEEKNSDVPVKTVVTEVPINKNDSYDSLLPLASSSFFSDHLTVESISISETSAFDVLGKQSPNATGKNRSKRKNSSLENFFTPESKKKQSTFSCKTPPSPFAAVISKNIKIYSPAEIESPNNQTERVRRMFWNKKAQHLVGNSNYHNWPKHAIIGVINSMWTLEKVDLLKEEANQLEIESDETQDEVVSKSVMSLVNRNLRRMLIARDAVSKTNEEIRLEDSLFKDIKTGVEREKSRNIIKKKRMVLDQEYAELKKAQDALRKSLVSGREKLTKNDESRQETQEIVITNVTAVEEADILDGVLEERETKSEQN